MSNDINTQHKKLTQTQTMLEKHHGDGKAFAQLMEETFSGRFNDAFWALWDNSILPQLSDNPTVLDLGTGPGTFIKTIARRHPGMRAIGVECAPYMLEQIGELPANAEILASDLQDPHFPLADDSVDAAISSVVVHEMHQPIRMFRELHRCLMPRGLFYLRDWVRAPLQMYLRNVNINPFDEHTSLEQLENLFVHFIEHNRFTRDDLVFMLEHTGFEVLQSELIGEGQHAWILARKIS